MLRFTTTHKTSLNISKPEHPFEYSDLHTTVVDDNIWLFFTHHHEPAQQSKIRIAVFDTKSHEFITLNCQNPNLTYWNISQITSHSRQIYISVRPQRWQDNKLLKFCPKTLTFTELFDRDLYLEGGFQVIGDYIYSLAIGENCSLVKINLSNMNVETHVLNVEPFVTFPQLMLINNSLYILKYNGNDIEVFIINENHEAHKLALTHRDIGRWTWLEDCVITCSPTFDTRYLETFDHENHKWIKLPIEQMFNDSKPSNIKAGLRSAVKKENTIYAVFKLYGRNSSYLEGGQFVISVLELKPKLSDICLLQLVDQLTSETDKEKENRFLDTFPIPLRCICGIAVE